MSEQITRSKVRQALQELVRLYQSDRCGMWKTELAYSAAADFMQKHSGCSMLSIIPEDELPKLYHAVRNEIDDATDFALRGAAAIRLVVHNEVSPVIGDLLERINQHTAVGRPPYNSGWSSARNVSDAHQSQQEPLPAREPNERGPQILFRALMREEMQRRGRPQTKEGWIRRCERIRAQVEAELEGRGKVAPEQAIEKHLDAMRKEDEGLRARLALEAQRTHEHFGWCLYYTMRDVAETLGHSLIALYRWVTR